MKSLNLLIKPASGSCDMRCAYCFYEDVGESRIAKRRGMMSLDTLERVVKAALAEAEELCTFGFQGGEPTLAGLAFFEALIEFERKHNARRIRIANTIQTNGQRIDAEWAAFLAKHRFLTGLSIDGPKDVHDALRPDAQGKGTHNRAMRAAQLLSSARAEFNVLSVVTRALASHPDQAYNFYKKHGFNHIQFIPCMDPLGEAPGGYPYSLDAALYGRFLCRIFELWHRDITQGNPVSIRMFDNFILMLMGHPPESCAMSGRCIASLVVEADGDTYPCDFYALDEHRLGNLRDQSVGELLNSGAARAFVKPSLSPDPACAACRYYPLCRGGCRRDRAPDGEPGGGLGPNRYCESYKMLFDHALPAMQGVARRMAGRMS